ncbi:hypothetical protein GN958_ATG07863, partial [Phytophthora infestans]
RGTQVSGAQKDDSLGDSPRVYAGKKVSPGRADAGEHAEH